MVNVTPNNAFGVEINKTAPKQKLSGADGKPIKHFGSKKQEGVTDDGTKVEVYFDVVNVTRPLGSISNICKKQNQVMFDDERS